MIEFETSGDLPPYLVLPGDRRIAVCGLGELPSYLDTGPSHVISLVDPGLSFQKLSCAHLLLRLHDIDQHLPGHDAPTRSDAEAVLSFVSGLLDLRDGFSLVVHCHAGISRSSASALAAMLVLEERLDPAEAVVALAEHRPMMWPNALLTGHYDRALGLDGSLIEAVQTYRLEAFQREFGDYR